MSKNETRGGHSWAIQSGPLIVGYLLASFAAACFAPLTMADEVSPAAAALETIFSPSRAPANRTMGLVQRNFLDQVENSKSKLQIAVVLDGTDSMDPNIAGIKKTIGKMMDDLELYKQAEVGYQLVVFRDIGAPLGTISFPFKVAGKKFVSDREAFQQALDAIETQSGAPYFHELIDVGVHAAIEQLEWSDDDDTSRWLLVIGDAPPFDVGFQETETEARRHYETRHLAGLATNKGILINCILCASRPEEQASYEAVLDRTRQFMSTLTSETGGLMLDLSYPDIRAAILAAAKKPRTQYVEIGKITEAEIQQLRDAALKAQSLLADSKRAQIAVLPHLPLDQMAFRANRPEVQLATDLRRRLRNIPGLEVKSSRAVQQRFNELQARGLQENQLLQMLANSLGVDYVLWGEMTEQNGLVQLNSSIYRRIDGRKIVSGRVSKESVDEATVALITNVVNSTVSNRSDARLVNVFNGMRNNDQAKTGLTTPVSDVKEAVSPLLEAYDLLEQVSAFEAGSPDADPFLLIARKSLEEVVQKDSRNPIAHQLLANCCFNQAQAAESKGDVELAKEEFATARAALEGAKSTRNRAAISDDMKTEILADYALLGEKDVAEAIQEYEKLTSAAAAGEQPVQLHMALRAHWMLAGIRSGDWGVDKSFVDLDQAREHLKAILAHWPKSHQAEFIRAKLRWDNQAGENALNHYPHQGPAFLDLIDS